LTGIGLVQGKPTALRPARQTALALIPLGLYFVAFGRAAALRAADIVKPGSHVREANGHSEERALQRFDRIRNSKGGNKPGEVRPQMQEAMQSSFGVWISWRPCAIRSSALPSTMTRYSGMSRWSRLWNLPI
jgi:hypothetical protein